MDRVRHAWLVSAFVVLFGCGGSNPSGPTPEQPSGPTVPAAPSGVRLVALDTAARSAIIQWDAVEGADRYVVEHWNVFDTSVTITSIPTAGAETTVTLRDLPGDWLSVRVRAGNAGGLGAPSVPPIMLQIPVQQDIVEALFFGTGPYGSGFFAEPSRSDYVPFFVNGAHASPGTMLGWSGGTVRVRVEEALTDAQFSNLSRILTQIAGLTGGYLRPEIVQRAGTLPDVFEAGEIHVMARDDLTVGCGNPDRSLQGCAPQLFLTGGQLIAARIYVRTNGSTDTVSHEAGHAVLGLHHVTRVQMPVRPVMSSSAGPSDNGFSTFEVDAIRAVYSAGLRFGASREEFQARGLIR